MRLLIIEDEQFLREALKDHMVSKQFVVTTAGTCEEGVRAFDRVKPMVTILDQELPDGFGAELCATLMERNPWGKVILCSAFLSRRVFVQALQNGVYLTLPKPFDIDELSHIVRNAFCCSRYERTIYCTKLSLPAGEQASSITTASSMMRTVERFIENDNRKQGHFMIVAGEQGAGKVAIAGWCHWLHRPDGPMATIDCQKNGELLDSVFHPSSTKGLTGSQSCITLLDLCRNGTLILENITDLPRESQERLCSALLIDRASSRNGSETGDEQAVLIGTSSISPESLKSGPFFNSEFATVFQPTIIEVPPLRERPEDFAVLVQNELAARGLNGDLITKEDIAALRRYSWPGNIQELKNVIELAAIRRTSERLTFEGLIPGVHEKH